MRPQWEAMLLLAYCLQLRKEALYSHPEHPMNLPQSAHYRRLIRQRCRGRALAYITGSKEFYGRCFTVSKAVLVPRPETELIVDTVLNLKNFPKSVHDACTGSGCVAITLAMEGIVNVSASDISRRALRVCSGNNIRHGAVLTALYRSNCLASVPGTYDLITANPPYLNVEELREVRRNGQDPRRALFGGEKGMRIIQKLLTEAPEHLNAGGMLVMEIAPEQKERCMELARSFSYRSADSVRDLSGKDRVLILRT